jgi:hypothetical protein
MFAVVAPELYATVQHCAVGNTTKKFREVWNPIHGQGAAHTFNDHKRRRADERLDAFVHHPVAQEIAANLAAPRRS